MEILIAVAITLLVLGFVGIPLLRERKLQEDVLAVDEEDTEVGRLLAQKETALTAIRELEFDYAVGNLSDGDYRELKDRYEKKAIAILRTLDEVSVPSANGHHAAQSKRAVKATRERRGERQTDEWQDWLSCPECSGPYSDGDRFCAACGATLEAYVQSDGQGEMGLLCSECGEPYDEDDAFCSVCGAQLLAADGGPYDEEEDVAEGIAPPSREAAQSPQAKGSGRRRRGRRGGRGRQVGSSGNEAS